MTSITTYRCDGCGAVLEGDPRQTGHGWRGVNVSVGYFTRPEIEATSDRNGIHRDYCPKCVPDWAKP